MEISQEIAVRLADEGVPLRAIARAVRIPSDELREHLASARAAGFLVDLPKEDWPPGFPRDQRALQLSRLVSQNRNALYMAVRHLFRFTPLEFQLFLLLVQNDFMMKARIEKAARTIDVHVCRIRRRLKPHALSIRTFYGYGYQMPLDDRKRAFDMILGHMQSASETEL